MTTQNLNELIEKLLPANDVESTKQIFDLLELDSNLISRMNGVFLSC